jgi:hypothetical protein
MWSSKLVSEFQYVNNLQQSAEYAGSKSQTTALYLVLKLKFDVPQSRISPGEDQTTFTADTNTEIGSFVLCSMSRAVLYSIPTGNVLKWNTSSVHATNK